MISYGPQSAGQHQASAEGSLLVSADKLFIPHTFLGIPKFMNSPWQLRKHKCALCTKCSQSLRNFEGSGQPIASVEALAMHWSGNYFLQSRFDSTRVCGFESGEHLAWNRLEKRMFRSQSPPNPAPIGCTPSLSQTWVLRIRHRQSPPESSCWNESKSNGPYYGMGVQRPSRSKTGGLDM